MINNREMDVMITGKVMPMDRYDINTYNFNLPADLIAQHLIRPGIIRLLVVDRRPGVPGPHLPAD